MKRACGLVAVLVSMAAWAEAPNRLPFQGRLVTAAGAPVEGAVQLRFRIYTTATPVGPSDIAFEETQTVQVTRGAFSTFLGAVEFLDLSMFKNRSELYVGVKVAADAQELAPLFRLGAAPWAAHANTCGDAASLAGQSVTTLASPNWSSIQNKPATLADDLDNDTLGGLSCPNGNAAVRDGGVWGCGAIPDAYTKTESDNRFARLASCYWINVAGDGGLALTATCNPGDYVVSGGCDGNSVNGSIVESFPGPSTGNYKNRPSGPWPVGTPPTDVNVPVIDRWLCRSTGGVLDSVYALCCPGR